jgi:hypothetical protein
VPVQKDFKRLVRARMKKTGEAYTAARLQLVSKSDPSPDYAERAGMSDGSVRKRTGRAWAEWVRVLDAAGAAQKPHREIAAYVSSLGTPGWWSQMVTVGYERIRGLREKGQRRSGLRRPNSSPARRRRVAELKFGPTTAVRLKPDTTECDPSIVRLKPDTTEVRPFDRPAEAGHYRGATPRSSG